MTTQPDFRAILEDDSYAATFQSLGQYRTALLKALPPPITPIPVSERSDPFNDDQGRCWCGTDELINETGDGPVDHLYVWELREPYAQDDCVMPHWAIPLPEESVG